MMLLVHLGVLFCAPFPLAAASVDALHGGGSAQCLEQEPPVSFLQAKLRVEKTGFQPPGGGRLPVGQIAKVLGRGGPGLSPDGTLASEAWISFPTAVAYDPRKKELWIAETGNNVVRVVDTLGRLRTAAGHVGDCTGVPEMLWQPGWSEECEDPGEDGPATSAHFRTLHGVELDLETGGVYLSDAENFVVRYIDPESRKITTVAGRMQRTGYDGDGGMARDARIGFPRNVALDQVSKDLYIADLHFGVVRKVDGQTKVISTFFEAGINSSVVAVLLASRPDGGQDLYVVDRGQHVVYRVDTATRVGVVVAGQPSDGSRGSGDGGPALHAGLCSPTGAVLDEATGDLYIVERSCHTIRRIDNTTGVISTIAGTSGVAGSMGNGGPAADALLDSPDGMAWDPVLRQIFVNEIGNHDIRILQI
jgi:DNA-binding beta-propeller fold protein YncE